MFNAPRRMGGATLAQSAFLNSSAGGNTYTDPLASSTPNPASFGDVDPWSAAPSPARSGTPRRDSLDEESVQAQSPPAVPARPARAVNVGEVSLSSVHRLLSTSKLPAATVEKIVNLTSHDKNSLSRREFFCSLALVALAQSLPDDDLDISIERLSASIPNLPLPRVSIPPASSTLRTGYNLSSPGPDPGSASPWDTTANQNGNTHHRDQSAISSGSGAYNGDGANPEAEAERGYWKRLETVEVTLIAEKEGWFLQKYRVESDKRSGEVVSRRYSDFVWLLDCLSKRYPFRILPALPPKRIGPDAQFLEQRRRALRRFINMIVNHPVMKDDGALNVFLTHTDFEAWRKRTKVSTEEESASKQLNPAQEMAIPADLEEKLGVLRDHLPSMLASYQKLVILAERSLGRLQAAAADASRFALSTHTVAEEMPTCCYRNTPGGGACSLCSGVARGFGEVGESWTRVAEEGEKRAGVILLNSIEALKTQRDLYLAFRDLFARHDHSVDSLRKKVESRQKKIESLRAAQKPGWEVEVDKLVAGQLDDQLASPSSGLHPGVHVARAFGGVSLAPERAGDIGMEGVCGARGGGVQNCWSSLGVLVREAGGDASGIGVRPERFIVRFRPVQ
ncbi:Sorting nexin mvp1 [Saitozyma podzolica]|uniref:Sorting nexin MVP1 n=1 Tax=Saitozyma podzolica TaxID=1890683 RepID=A0A427YW59_9TREE|nr:Sorting nexin mvp1 [Saitozyma podzolica]